MEAHYIGIDIGSTATKLAALSGERALLGTTVVPFGTGTQADQLALETFYRNSRLSPSDCVRTIATGYGRLIFRGADAQVSEISCHAKGLHHFLPQARTIIDVGGQDLKAIQINDRGSVQQFVMNDKCAAGTGRFLEVMSRVMGLEVFGSIFRTANSRSSPAFSDSAFSWPLEMMAAASWVCSFTDSVSSRSMSHWRSKLLFSIMSSPFRSRRGLPFAPAGRRATGRCPSVGAGRSR